MSDEFREGTPEYIKEMCRFIENEFGRDAWNPCGNAYSVKDIEKSYLTGYSKLEQENARLKEVLESIKPLAELNNDLLLIELIEKALKSE